MKDRSDDPSHHYTSGCMLYISKLNYERNVLFNNALTFYLWVFGRKEMFYLIAHSTHFYLWLFRVRNLVKEIAREETSWTTFPISRKGFFFNAPFVS